MVKIITICNQKGGVGKTTTAVNLAACLAKAGKTTLLVDMDPQGNATSGSGIDKTSIESSIYDVLTGQNRLAEIIRPTRLKNFKVAPSTLDLTGAEIELVGAVAREYKLKSSLEPVQQDYDYVFIDTPPSLGLLTLNALTACNSVFVPLQCEYYALEGLSKLVNTVELVRNNLNSEAEIEGVILTMADYRTNLTHEVIEEIKKHFGEKVFKSVIPRSIRLSEAPGHGLPIILYEPSSAGAVKYTELAQEVLAQTQNQPAALPEATQEATKEQDQPEA